MNLAKLPAHEATTAQLGAAYPFAASAPLPARRVLVGRDLAGGPFFHDPFLLYSAGALTNPNIAVFGQIGRGKSALVKTYLYRQAAFGRQVAVLDPKGEYAPLARALGVEPIHLAPEGGVRINPLDDAGLGLARSGSRHRRLELVGALAEATLKRRLGPREHLALEVGVDSAASRTDSPTLGDVVDTVLAPSPEQSEAAGASRATLTEDGRDVGLELRRLVRGDLAGMFDGQTSPSIASLAGRTTGEARAALIVDLSEVYQSEALPALMVCAAAWLLAMTSHESTQTILVVDEAWAVLGDAAVGRVLRSSWKLSRARGIANVAVCHRASDLSASGAAGSLEARLAEGLLTDSETVVCYSQPASELADLAGQLGCSVGELDFLPRLPRGRALWRVGGRSYLVDHLVSSAERGIVDTDARLRQPSLG
ncbi:MAG: ATP-binding protein [Acidimicrobiales bacterium]